MLKLSRKVGLSCVRIGVHTTSAHPRVWTGHWESNFPSWKSDSPIIQHDIIICVSESVDTGVEKGRFCTDTKGFAFASEYKVASPQIQMQASQETAEG